MREPSAAAVAEGSVCVTELAKDARRVRDGQRAAERADRLRGRFAAARPPLARQGLFCG